jgi:hypothetical protein
MKLPDVTIINESVVDPTITPSPIILQLYEIIPRGALYIFPVELLHTKSGPEMIQVGGSNSEFVFVVFFEKLRKSVL